MRAHNLGLIARATGHQILSRSDWPFLDG